MKFERVYAAPTKWTFQIKSIKKLLQEEMNDGIWIDPYSGMTSPATITNDINPKMPTTHHKDALEFVTGFDDNSVDGVLLDPPYSHRQVSDCYKELGIPVTMHVTQSSFYLNVQKQVRRILKPNGKVISFGYNSNGVNDQKNFETIRILLVHFGSHRYDIIVTVEKKVTESLFPLEQISNIV